NSKMTTLVTQKLIIRREKKGLMHVDGEPVETGREISVEIIQKGLKVLVPSEKKKKKEAENIFSSLTRWFNE
ncbi:MAG TPA: diacylglycerol kinase family lipid kinase, partial [Proteiniphilum sp.]|nr:diacylglycerol kinase family lipid kinase [Proteiniphilum sp.]